MQSAPQTQSALTVRIFETTKNVIDAVKQDPRDVITLEIAGFESSPVYRGRETRDPAFKARSRVRDLVEEVVGPASWISSSQLEIRPTIKRTVSLPVHQIPAWPEDAFSETAPFRTQSAPRQTARPTGPSKGFIPVHRHTPRR